MNVVAWVRVSSREQREGHSIDAQTRAMRDKAAKAGWTIIREFAVAESAKRGADRVAFNQMFKWVKANAKRQKIDAIFAHKLDRVCRNMRDAMRLQELEDTCGVQLSFVENQFGPGAAGALSFNVMAAVAQYYSDNLRTEVLKGMDEKVRQGWPTGLAPYGYLNVDDRTEPVVPHPEKSKTVIRIFELYASSQHTFKSLADKLAAEAHTYRPSQPRFFRTALSYILNNRFYIGELERNGQIFKGNYRLLIDRKLFDACQDILNGRNRRTGNPDIAFSGGIFRCACCDFARTGELIRRKLNDGGCNEHIYYRCGNNHPDNGHPKISKHFLGAQTKGVFRGGREAGVARLARKPCKRRSIVGRVRRGGLHAERTGCHASACRSVLRAGTTLLLAEACFVWAPEHASPNNGEAWHPAAGDTPYSVS